MMKNIEKGTKRTIIFSSLLLIICIIIIILVNIRTKSIYIVVNDRGLQYNNSSWSNIDLKSQIFGKYKFNVYKGNENKGVYEINYVNDQWYFFDENNDSYHFDEGDLLAYYGDVDVVGINVESLTIDDLSIINEALKEKDLYISTLDELSSHSKVVYDFDNDNKNEVIYTLNNIDTDADYAYTVLLYQNDDDLKLMNYRMTSMDAQDDLDLYSFNNVIRLNGKSTNYLILTDSKNLDISSTYNLVYSFKGKDYKLVKGYNDGDANIRLTEKDYFGRTILIIILIFIGGIGIIYWLVKKKSDNQNEI